ncbi:uncharacterized protein F4817DRAFT_309263 [Daldinia loculata]|uniref:uncharacterized protein n=1 Tax=Daldinia loculata TaxID=103429 RepID=UPI0020C35BD1|nr:uncharacterized protein F4817DRAFT_309263 [Daldinia loculata]KAI1642148.1 hypothetical protein F4817DRAFT_309263 [Daldinia loculata]
MMATEPTLNKPDASLTEPTLAQSAVASNDTQDASHSSATLNGVSSDVENKQIAEIVDELVNSAEVSVSGGSDTETSKARLGDKNHARTSSSLKKPQSFKSVSVNRTFLASKSTTNSTSRPDSSANSASTAPLPAPSASASRLKLVAKSGSSLGGSTKTLSSNGKPAAAPDPNTVWNRNRPAAQPEQKKLSDEELMHKYGIHMAGRLGPEDTKGQSNWADIDDDEEWEPETITWTDGTKITLPPPDEIVPSPGTVHATLSKEPAPAPPKSKSPAPTPSATESPSLRPGTLASSKSLVLKGAPEKPTLVAKPPAPPTPAKSPWARLPPIEKVPPGQPDLSSLASSSRPPVRDAATMSATPPPTKEIAADDFSRSGFREGHTGNHSQLFNSHSGRYEPVTDRRGSRNDAHGRQPAVLQRPQHHDQQGPAEPSAAFQTSRTSAHEAPFGRRRGSSNVSGTSGIMAHRLGKPYDIPPPPEVIQSQAGSVVGAESPISTTFSPVNNQITPRLQPSHPYQPRPSPGQTYATPQYNPPSADAPSNEDEFAVQRRVMRERREQAIKRRLEQEAREEEARKARIAEKLKAMGPPPERKSAKKEGKNESSTQPVYPGRTSIPSTSDEKPEALSKATADSTATVNKNKSNTDRQVNGDAKQPPTQAGKPSMAKSQSAASWPEAPQHPERFTSWVGSSQNSSRNVWGAPGNDRSLGNGTFNPDLGTLPDAHPAPITERIHRPAPIGPPRSSSQQPVRPETMSSNRIPPIGPPRGRPSNIPEQDLSSSWNTFTTNVQEDDRRRAAEMQDLIHSHEKNPTIPIKDTWRPRGNIQDTKRGSANPFTNHNEAQPSGSFNGSRHIGRDERLRPELSAEEIAKRKGLMPSDFAARDAARDAAREAAAKEVNGIRPEFGRQPPVGHTGRNVPGPATQPRSSSRFFPSARDVSTQDNGAQEEARGKSPTPPPPTADGHPVYDGDVTRPHVALPPARPVVKLPPPTNSAAPSPLVPSAKPAPISFAAAAAAPVRGNAQATVPRPSSRGKGYAGIPQKPHEIASQENWQDKINSLMGKKPVHQAKSMAIDSSSKIALEHTHSYDPATVALPGLSHSVSSIASDDSDYTSKEMAEECFGEQEMGSLPAVRLPNEAPDALWQAVEPNFDPTPAKLRVDPTCAEALRFPPEVSNGKSVIRISTPFMLEAKTVLVPFVNNRSTSNPRRSGPRGTPRRLSGRGGQRGGREHSDHAGDHASSHSPGRPSTRSGRGSYRPRTENWSRHTPTTPAA